MPRKKTANKTAVSKSYPVYVWLKSPNPYNNKVKVCGIEITCKKTVIDNPETMALFKSVSAFINVEPVNPPAEAEEKEAESSSEPTNESDKRVAVDEIFG